MSKSDEFAGPFQAMWAPDALGLAEQMRTGPVAMARIGQVVALTGQAIAARQAQHLKDVIADVTVLFSDAAPRANDPQAMARACTAFVQSSLQRQVSLFSFYAETLAGAAQQTLMAPHGAPEVHGHEPAVLHNPPSKANGRAVPANS